MAGLINEKFSKTESEKNSNNGGVALKLNRYDCAFFRKGDLVVYLVLAALIALLFVFIFLPSNDESKGFTVSREGVTLLTYTHQSEDPIWINPDYENIIQTTVTDGGYSVKIYLFEGSVGYNTVFFDTINRTAKVADSNCSERKDCFHSPAVSNSGSIYCNPHGLLIKPIGSAVDTPITG